jgi:hypothetical protein
MSKAIATTDHSKLDLRRLITRQTCQPDPESRLASWRLAQEKTIAEIRQKSKDRRPLI